MIGDNGENIIGADAGNDVVSGKDGQDTMLGADGDDVINGGNGVTEKEKINQRCDRLIGGRRL